MLLRSSSTPILGSLLSSFSESPNNNFHQSESSISHSCSRLSRGSQNFSTSLSHSSPSVADSGFRRVQSERNLEELAKQFARKPKCSHLEAIPSISSHSVRTRYEDEDSDKEEFVDDEEFEIGENSNRFRVEDVIFDEERINSNRFMVENVIFDEKSINVNDFGSQGKLYLAAGLGASGGNSGGRIFRPVAFGRDGGDNNNNRDSVSIEEHYKKLLEENPGNSMFLRNYAQFLYQKKGDFHGAEEYYSRAILSDPEDGEVLLQYAQLIWEFKRDKERANDYFERAVQASAQDSHIHAAYASFLWDIEDEDEEGDNGNSYARPINFHQGAMASASA